MRWVIAAPFFESDRDTWIDDFSENSVHSFEKIPKPASSSFATWHSRRGRETPVHEWMQYWAHATKAAQANTDGVISVFPQLALMLAIKKIFSRRKFPVIAWCFNVGAKPSKAKTFISKILLKQVDVFVVHSRGEVESLYRWFGIPRDKIRFVHLQRAPIEILSGENSSDPFIVAMGSANRDYGTLISAVREVDIKCKIVASSRTIDATNLPPNVEVINGLTASECHLLAQQARVNVIPLADVETASGQVTIVEAMRMGRPIVVTEGVGSVDYIKDGFDGLLVPPQDAPALKRQIERLWNSEELRTRLSQNSMETAKSKFSDEVAAASLIKIMDEFVTSN